MRRIIVVDEDEATGDAVRGWFGGGGRVVQVPTAADAIRRLDLGGLDAAVVEHRLPDGSGLDVVSAFRARAPNVPVIFVTATGSEWTCVKAFRMGVSDYLVKPLEWTDLDAALGRLFPGGGQAGGRLGGRWPRSRRGRSRSSPHVRRAMRFVQEHYPEVISLGRLAKEVGLNPFSLSRRFRASAAMTFREYLVRCRLEKARELLVTSDYSVTEIALMVGFGDLPRFDKLFKRFARMAPSAYRRRHRAAGPDPLAPGPQEKASAEPGNY